MWRILAVLTLLLSGAIVGSGSWMLFHPFVTPLLVPGATDIQVVSTGVWEWRITYDASGPPYAWYFTLSRMIEGQGWTARRPWQPDGSTMFDPVWPRRFEWVYTRLLWDEVVLIPDQNHSQRATIRLRRSIHIPWWP
jgi:hypothetical protein